MSEPLGYARVSTAGQDAGAQVKRLREHGCARVWVDVAARYADQRAELAGLLAYARSGDVLVVTRLDRLGDIRTLPQLAGRLEGLGVGLAALDHQIDTATAYGRGALYMLAVLAQIESDVRRERQEEAWAAGKQRGRPASLTSAQVDHALRLRTVDGQSFAQIAEILGTTKSTIQRALRLAPGTALTRPLAPAVDAAPALDGSGPR